jgi:hypothetical protein
MKTPHRPDYRVLQSSPSSTAEPAKSEAAPQPETMLLTKAHRPNYAELQSQNEAPPEIKSEEPPRLSNQGRNPYVPAILRHADASLPGMDKLANERIKAMAFERAQLEDLKQREAAALDEQSMELEKAHTEDEKPKALAFFEDLHPDKEHSHDFDR